MQSVLCSCANKKATHHSDTFELKCKRMQEAQCGYFGACKALFYWNAIGLHSMRQANIGLEHTPTYIETRARVICVDKMLWVRESAPARQPAPFEDQQTNNQEACSGRC
jgi:hypothetical protein